MSEIEYKKFWDNMSKHYPVSKWDIRLPIATKLLTHDSINPDLLINNCKSILEKIIAIDKSKKIKFMHQNQEEVIENLFENDYTWSVRFDCMLDQNNNIKIIEMNADHPDWLLMHDNTYSVLSNKEFNLHKKNFLEFFDKNEKIFILYPEGAFFKDSYYTEYYFLRENWFDVDIWTFSDLEFDNNKVYYKWKKVDKIRKLLEVSKLAPEIWKSFHNRDIKFVNTFDIRLLGYKDLLSEVEHPYILEKLDLNEENKNKILNNKDSYVIKASNWVEWFGIHIGKDIRQSEWVKIIEENLNKNFIAQEFLQAQKFEIDFFENDNIIRKNLYFDVCPHFFVKNWKIISEWLVLARFSENKILNVAKWWGIWYLRTI